MRSDFGYAISKAIPIQAWTGSQEGEDPIFPNNRHMKVVSLSALGTGLLYPQEVFLVLNSVRDRVGSSAIMWPEGLSQRKISMTPSGIERATFRLIAQCLSWYSYFLVTSI